MTDAAWRVVIQDKEKRYLARLPRRERERLLDAMLAMGADPLAGDVAKLKGRLEGYRLRVGRWRILFMLDAEARTVIIAGMGPRGDVYK
ncbi:MAG: type II toxin-antitoxin system RelE family toxin [Thermodesulfobacteriota bacterium]